MAKTGGDGGAGSGFILSGEAEKSIAQIWSQIIRQRLTRVPPKKK
jgi:hypothetical protein